MKTDEATPPPDPAAEGAPAAAPIVVVDHDTYQFGIMDANATGTHEFTFSNQGTAPLKLTKGETTCKCTIAEVDEQEIPPGGSVRVKLQWHGKGFTGDYRQTATILTNDPKRQRVTLTVSGRVVSAVKAVPEELVLSSVTAGEEARGQVELLGYLPTPLKITGYEMTENKTAGLFAVQLGPISSEALAKDKDAKSGAVAQVIVKPGLPVGAFRQTIRFRTNFAEAPTLDVPVRGSVVSDLAVVGGGWDAEHSLLTLGSVSSQTGGARTVLVIARGPFRDQVKLKVAEVWPEWLQVEVGPPRDGGGALMRQTPVVIRVPPGSPPGNYWGTETAKVGRVLLETNHPRAATLLIRVRFAVGS